LPGIGISLVLFAIGAIYWGTTVTPYQHGFNIHNVGVILMIVAAVGVVLSLVFWLPMTMRRRRTTYQQGPGYAQREDVETF
jgi:cytochrome c biogenesis protein CcdA